MKELIKVFFKDFSVYSIQPILLKLISFFLIPIYTSYLTPADYGNLQFILTFGSFFSIIIGLGVNSSFWKFKSKDNQYNAKLVALNLLLIQIYTGLILFIISTIIYLIFFNQKIIGLLILAYFLAELISTIYNASLLFYRSKHQSKKYLLSSVLQTCFLFSANIIAIVYFKLNYTGIILAYLISYTISSLLQLKYVFNECKGKFDKELANEMVKYGLPIMFANLAMIIVSLSDRFFLKSLSTDRELGLYSYGYKLADLIKVLVISPFLLAWTPIRWKIYELANHAEIFSRINKYIISFLPAVSLIIASLILLIANLFTIDKNYMEFVKIFSIIVYANVFYGFYFFNSMGLLFKSKTKTLMNLIIFASVINIIINFILIPKFGMLGAAFSTITSYLILFLSTLYYSQKYFPIIRSYLKESFQTILCILSLIILTMLSFRTANIYLLSFYHFAIAIVYLLISFLMNMFSITEIKKIILIFVNKYKA